jgi:Uma2 family endonuclease
VNIALPEQKMTVSEFLAWWESVPGDDRFELVDGQVIAMGRDRASHNRAKMRAVNCLAAAIGKAGVDCEAFVDGMGVSANQFNYRLPDAVVHCGNIDSDALVADNPVIAVEVVSPSSEERDVHAKLHDYFAITSVEHYLIIYDDRGYVVHHRRRGEGPLETSFVTEGEIDLMPPGIRVSVDELLGKAAR